MKHLLIASIVIASVLAGCNHASQPKIDETPTRGTITIGVDDSYRLLSEAETYAFEATYKDAHVNTIYASEDSILQLFIADSIRLMITSRQLTKNEELYLQTNQQIYPVTTKIAHDALAFIVNKSNPDSLIRYNTIRDIFSGNVTQWKQVNGKANHGDITVVFDNARSANVRYVMEKFKLKKMPSLCYAADSNVAVVDYVEKHPDALGIISVNWISDPQDSVSHAFLNRINVVAVTSEVYSEGEDFYTPHPAYIADKSYPFIREVYAIKRETFSGLGSGFIAYVAGDIGQRIVLKSGMVPATMPIRLIKVNNE